MRDHIVADELIRQARNHHLPVVIIDGSRSVGQVAREGLERCQYVREASAPDPWRGRR